MKKIKKTTSSRSPKTNMGIGDNFDLINNRLPEIDIPEETPFQNDKFNRQSCANVFYNLVELYSQTGCVIALNGEWGTGKTTFVKMWKKYMEHLHYRTIYFNAWETDYINDPLVALLGELGIVIGKKEDFNNVCASVSRIALTTGSVVLSSILKQSIGISAETLQAALNETKDIFKETIQEYTKQKTSIAEFKKKLKEYVANVKEDEPLPLIFIIDELDRCNPAFAVHLLERIKLLFDIPNVIFVLSINRKQLCHAIQGYFGNSNFEADKYLRRFIDIEYSLPLPNSEAFCEYLYDIYDFNHIFKYEKNKVNNNFLSDSESLKKMANILITSFKLDLRTTDKIFAHTRLVSTYFKEFQDPDVFFFLICIKIVHSDLYNDIMKQDLTVQKFLYELEEFLPSGFWIVKDSSLMRYVTRIITYLVIIYNLSDDGLYDREKILSEDGIHSNLKTKHLDQDVFDDVFNFYKGKLYSSIRAIMKCIELDFIIK